MDDVEPGDSIVVDGGMVSLEVASKAGPDVVARVVDPGIILSRANLTFRRGGAVLRARNAMLPVLSAKDWLDIDFAIAEKGEREPGPNPNPKNPNPNPNPNLNPNPS